MSISTTQGTICLRDSQKEALVRLLNLNSTDDTTSKPVWKILIFDRIGVDVFSAVMRKMDLRDQGITLHLKLDSERYPIPDTPAIYFIEPTEANIDTVIQDLKNDMYESAYVNFSSSISRVTLEYFAERACKENLQDKIRQIYDQYLNFVVNDRDLFSLRIPNAFSIFNDPRREAEIEGTIGKVVLGLFSVVVTMEAIPIIRCPKGGPAEVIAERLDRKLRDHLKNSRNSIFRNVNTLAQRPLLLILDRTIDISPMLSHSWSYQALVHDVLGLKNNKVTIKLIADDSKGSEDFDLDSRDFFWAKNANKPFPQVAENVDAELNRYRDDAAEILRRTGVDNLDDLNTDGATSSTTHLNWAMGQLPELSVRKKVIDAHFNILTALLEKIKERQIDNYFQLEESITKVNKQQMLKVIKESNVNHPEDVIRFFIVWYLSVDDVPRADMSQYETALKEAGCDLSVLTYVKRIREFTKMTMMTSPLVSAPSGGFSSTGGDFLKGLGSLSNKISEKFREAGISSQLESLVSGVKSLIPGRKDLTLSRITEASMDPALSSSYTQAMDYLLFDPRLSKALVGKSGPSRHVFQEAIVFTVGGGNYLEYGNLQDWAERHSQPNSPQRVFYGSTELLSPQEFIAELAAISGT